MSDSTARDETALAEVEMLRPRWGDPTTPEPLPDAAAALAPEDSERPGAGVDPDDLTPPESDLPAPVLVGLGDIIGERHVATGAQVRVQHTRGYSTTDLLRMRAGDVEDAPDAVVFPGTHDEVVAILQLCAHHRVAVVPFTGGTSVVGGLAPVRAGMAGVVSVDLRRLDRVIEIDDVSRTATLEAGLRGVRAEELLRAHGFTVGHFPQSYAGAGIGGYAATRSAGQASAGYGRFDEIVEQMVLATPQGTLRLGTAPRSAAGPDLRELVLGSEGVLGIITAVTVRVRPVPAQRVYEGWRFATFAAGLEALRTLAQDGPELTVLRLSDESETAINLADPDQIGSESSGCLAVIGVEGDADDVTARCAAAAAIAQRHGGTSLGSEPGESWRRGRFRAPYLRDPLLDAGVLVETLETATFWSRIPALREAVTDAVTAALTEAGTPPMVLCHVSHVYASGASLYFTVVCPQAADPVAQWATAKTAANAAIRRAGASITHHHGVGRDHRETYHEEIGELAVDMLSAAKAVVDPEGICNPGVLV